MKKVLFINHSCHVHGAETVMLHLLNVIEEKQNIHVVEPCCNEYDKFQSALEQMGITKILKLPYKALGISVFRSILVVIYNLYSVLKLLFYVRKEKIDLIYSNTSITCLGIVVAFIANKPHIWHFHEPVEADHGFVRPLNFIYKCFLSYKKNRVVFVSKRQHLQWKNEIPKYFDDSLIIYNPIKEIKILKHSDKQKVVFGYMGDWCKRKNIPFFINTLEKLRKEYANVSLLLAKNTGDDIEKIEESIKNVLNLDIVIETFTDASVFYAMIDIFVLPSLSETWGLVAVEAMLSKKAVILTENTGLHELFKHEDHCLFINPYKENDLYKAMSFLMNEKKREIIAENGYNKVQSLNVNVKFEDSFRRLINNL